MPGSGIIQAVTLCAALVGEPSGCLSNSHPSAQLFRTECELPEITSVSPGWRAGLWRGQRICWRQDPGKSRVRIIAGNEAVQYVEISANQEQCTRVYCNPEINVQNRNHKGTK